MNSFHGTRRTTDEVTSLLGHPRLLWPSHVLKERQSMAHVFIITQIRRQTRGDAVVTSQPARNKRQRNAGGLHWVATHKRRRYSFTKTIPRLLYWAINLRLFPSSRQTLICLCRCVRELVPVETWRFRLRFGVQKFCSEYLKGLDVHLLMMQIL